MTLHAAAHPCNCAAVYDLKYHCVQVSLLKEKKRFFVKMHMATM